ncbi:MAG TPA: MipA/OmpV family protein [Burkholderiales bacterium]|nr:MipA/OmpV family protein [Burkholderiales bacterium]
MIRRATALLCVSLFAVFCGPVFAQSTDDEKYIGAGARLRPAYDGADSTRVDAIPYVRLYGEHFFARTVHGLLEGGWRTQPLGGVIFGAQAAYEEGRRSRDSAFLSERHFDDLDPSVSLGVHAESSWKIGPVPMGVLLRYRHDVEADNGAQADVRAAVGILDWRGWRAGLFGQWTWNDTKATQRYFGITPQQSATSGLPAYSPGSGTRYVQAGLLGDIDIARHWVGLWTVNWQQLQADAADSPLTQQRDNWFANAGVAYRF